ncbi:biopolymer transporter ExbD [Rhodobacteraceae bacterium]|nr:biopolymer transporter ExbD [Paracoccaceae bacterium]
MIQLERQSRPLPVVSIIPLVDVLLILLVFFMVTSTFLNLDMLPMSAPEAQGSSPPADARTLLVRVLPGGDIVTAGQRIPPDSIDAFLQNQSQDNTRLLLLPSPHADVQALVRVLDTAARLGLNSVSVLQFSDVP